MMRTIPRRNSPTRKLTIVPVRIIVIAMTYHFFPLSKELVNAHENGPIRLDIIKPKIDQHPC